MDHAGQRDCSWKIRRLANKITSEFTHHDFFGYVPWTHFGSPLCIVACNNYAQLTQRAASCVISRCTHSWWSVDFFFSFLLRNRELTLCWRSDLKKKKRKKYQHSHRDAQKQTTRCFFKIKIYITNSFIIIAIYIIIITMILVLLSFHSFFFINIK